MSKNNVKHRTKKAEKVSNGIIHINTSFNNVIVTATDLFGNTLVSCSAGRSGFNGAKKGTPFAAQVVAETVAKNAQEIYSLKTVVIVIKGPGAGRESAMRAINSNGLIVTAIKDVTPIPHNGCRRPKRRRV